jgi:hypothetical protein
MPRTIVCWFSCGVTSAVATKLALAQHAAWDDVLIARMRIANEHEDNDRFAADCEAWFGRPIIDASATKYRDAWDVWERRRYLNGHDGAPCTLELKKAARWDFEQRHQPDMQVFGFDADERKRAERFRQQNPEVRLITPLIDAGLTKADCAALVERAGIALPAMYALGFRNNNCKTCVKARSPGYWALVRQCFPDDFVRMAALSRDIGWSPCRASDDSRVWLDELPADTPPQDNSPDIECSLLCAIAEDKITEAQEARDGE